MQCVKQTAGMRRHVATGGSASAAAGGRRQQHQRQQHPEQQFKKLSLDFDEQLERDRNRTGRELRKLRDTLRKLLADAERQQQQYVSEGSNAVGGKPPKDGGQDSSSGGELESRLEAFQSSISEFRKSNVRLLDTLEQEAKDLTGELLEANATTNTAASAATHVEQVTDVDQLDHPEQKKTSGVVVVEEALAPPPCCNNRAAAPDDACALAACHGKQQQQQQRRKNISGRPPSEEIVKNKNTKKKEKEKRINTKSAAASLPLSGWSREDRGIFMREVFKTELGGKNGRGGSDDYDDDCDGNERLVQTIWSLTSGQITGPDVVKGALHEWKAERERRRKVKGTIDLWKMEKQRQREKRKKEEEEKCSRKEDAKQSIKGSSVDQEVKKKKISEWREMKHFENELKKTDEVLERVEKKLGAEEAAATSATVVRKLEFNKDVMSKTTLEQTKLEIVNSGDKIESQELRMTLLNIYQQDSLELGRIRASAKREALENEAAMKTSHGKPLPNHLDRRNPDRIFAPTKSFAGKNVRREPESKKTGLSGPCIEFVPKLATPDWRKGLCYK